MECGKQLLLITLCTVFIMWDVAGPSNAGTAHTRRKFFPFSFSHCYPTCLLVAAAIHRVLHPSYPFHVHSHLLHVWLVSVIVGTSDKAAHVMAFVYTSSNGCFSSFFFVEGHGMPLRSVSPAREVCIVFVILI